MMQKVLESIYEALFLECSYGFRAARGCHTAMQGLQNHLHHNNIQTLTYIDLKNLFRGINQEVCGNGFKEKLIDTNFMKYINRMFKAGVLSNADLRRREEGGAEGSICSPVLAKVFARHPIGVCIEEMVKPSCRGSVELF
jgi:retron-type reverse transcriptase